MFLFTKANFHTLVWFLNLKKNILVYIHPKTNDYFVKRGIKMFHYKGSKEMGYIQPRVLASYDIVITTYETLSTETNYVDLPHTNSSEGRRFRNPKR